MYTIVVAVCLSATAFICGLAIVVGNPFMDCMPDCTLALLLYSYMTTLYNLFLVSSSSGSSSLVQTYIVPTRELCSSNIKYCEGTVVSSLTYRSIVSLCCCE